MATQESDLGRYGLDWVRWRPELGKGLNLQYVEPLPEFKRFALTFTVVALPPLFYQEYRFQPAAVGLLCFLLLQNAAEAGGRMEPLQSIVEFNLIYFWHCNPVTEQLMHENRTLDIDLS